MTQVPDRPVLTLREAAEACSVSLSTIKRRHRAGAFENAAKDSEGRWVIPVNDLLGAGFRLNRPADPVTKVPDPPSAPAEPPELTHLKHEVELERARRHYAEQLADERLRQIEDYRATLRMLEAGPSAQPTETPATVQPAPQPEPSRRRWWQRRTD